MPNTRISNLTAATSVAGTDVYPSVQTAGVGPVKTSLTQITAFALANAPAGAVATPSIAPTGDTNTGFWFPAADTIAASTSGQERMRINSSGNVGIGTTSPSTTLDVRAAQATFGLTSTTTTNTAYSSFNNAGGIFYAGIDNSGGSAFSGTAYSSVLWSTAAAPMVFATNGSEKMRITSAGNVGIGTTSPSQKLTVEASTSATIRVTSTGNANLDITCDATQVQFGSPNGIPILFNTAGSEKMRITSAGNVGIGTASPGGDANNRQLTLTGSTTAQVTLNNSANNFNFGINGSSVGYAEVTGANPLVFLTNGTERMRITSAGNLLIGTTSSPTTGTQCLTIETETAPTATPADTVTFYSSDLSAGNTMPSFYTEGTIVGTGTPTADRTIAVRINGTVYYLLASTIP